MKGINTNAIYFIKVTDMLPFLFKYLNKFFLKEYEIQVNELQRCFFPDVLVYWTNKREQIFWTNWRKRTIFPKCIRISFSSN